MWALGGDGGGANQSPHRPGGSIEVCTGAVVADHALVAPGEASVLDEHYGSTRPAVPPRAVRPKTATEKQFCALGPVAQAFLTGAAAAGHTRLGAELGELLALDAARRCWPR